MLFSRGKYCFLNFTDVDVYDCTKSIMYKTLFFLWKSHLKERVREFLYVSVLLYNRTIL